VGNWTTRVGEDGSTYGYQVIMKDMLNFFEAHSKCNAIGGEAVSIHSAAENEFVRQLAAPYISQCQTNTSVCASRTSNSGLDYYLRVIWLGMHRVQFDPFYNYTIDCIWEDGTPCDFANYTAVNTGPSVYPWGYSCPSGTNGSQGVGDPEDCVSMYNATGGLWNDLSCYQKLGGVVCKKNCSATCTSSSATTLASIISTLGTSTTSLATTLNPTTITTTPAQLTTLASTLCTGSPTPAATTLLAALTTQLSGGGSTSTINALTTALTNAATTLAAAQQTTVQPISTSTTSGPYICGSDSFKNYRKDQDGNYYAYKTLPLTTDGSYFDGRTTCGNHGAIVCPITSNDENNFVIGAIQTDTSYGSGRKRRQAVNVSCIFGLNRYKTNPNSSVVNYNLENGSPCIYGNVDLINTTPSATTGAYNTTLSSTTVQQTTTNINTTPSTTTAAPTNPWADGCPTPAGQSFDDPDGYGQKNCAHMINGKWADQSCTKPATYVVCRKVCIPPGLL